MRERVGVKSSTLRLWLNALCARTSLHHIAHQSPGADFGPIDDAVLVGGDTFGRTGGVGFVDRIGNEIFHRSVFGAAHANAAFPAVMILGNRFGFGIGDIDDVIGVDIDAAWAAELRPAFQKLAILIENLDAVVVAVADEQ